MTARQSAHILRHVCMAALVVGVSQFPTVPAAAAGSYVVGTTYYRDCTNVSLPGCARRAALPDRTPVTMACWIDDSNVTERFASSRWFYVVGPNAVRGFVHSSRVTAQTTVGRCTSHRSVAPSRWAAMEVGSYRPSSTEARGTGADRWSGWCYLLASDAHIFGYNNTPLTGYASAKKTYYEYERRGLVNRNFDPRAMNIGAIVFWTFGNYGHAAVYVGNGYVVSTQGSGSDYRPVARLPLSNWNTSGRPVGWVAPTNV